MRPIKLTFAGLRSYRAETTIDFTELDLFAIIGDTGAGKSTIIEALSFALYGRKTWSGGAVITDLITDGQTTMRIEFEFEAGGDRWTVTRSRHRNSGAAVNRLVSATGAERIDGAGQVTERIEQLLGLDHAQFTKAVIMPQGRFDELLRAQPRERTKVLTSILGLDDIVTVRERSEQARDQWRPELERSLARRAMLPADPAGELSRASAKKAELAVLVDQLSEAVRRLDEIEPLKAALDRSTERLRLSRDLVPELDDDWCDRLDDLAEQQHRWRTAVDVINSHIEETRTELDRLDQIGIEQLDGFANRDELIASQSTVDQIAGKIEHDLGQLKLAQGRVTELESATPPDAVDQALVDAHTQASREAEQAADLEQQAKQQLEHGKSAWVAVCAHREAINVQRLELERLDTTYDGANSGLLAATKLLEEARQKHDDARDARESALSSDAACRAATGHAEGDDCPVCARPLPPGFKPPSPPDVDAVEELVARTRTALEAADAKHREAERHRDGCQGAVGRAGEALTGLEGELAAAVVKALELGVDAAASSDFDALRKLSEGAQEASTNADESRSALQREADALEEARRELHARHVRHTAQLDQAREFGERCQETLDDHRHRLNKLPDGWRLDDVTTAAVTNLAERLRGCRETLDDLHGRRQMNAAKLDDLKQKLEDSREHHRTEIEAPARAAHAAVDKWSSRITELYEEGTEAARVAESDAPEEPVALEDIADDLAGAAVNARSVVQAGRQLLADIEAMLASLVASLERTKAAIRAVIEATECPTPGEVRTKLGESRSQLAQAHDTAENAERALAEAGQLDDLLAVLEPYVRNLSVLAASLRDSNFIRHLVASREADLLSEATRRLKVITGGKFGFASGFDVVNLLSGEKRPPDTLSGGERFQAALGLALALVEIASRGGGRLDAVFIDEGFGSLDSNALDVALEALANVSGDGKSVALISHLRPVAEYVDKVLHVTWDDVNGSKINVLTSDAQEHLLADDARSGLTS